MVMYVGRDNRHKISPGRVAARTGQNLRFSDIPEVFGHSASYPARARIFHAKLAPRPTANALAGIGLEDRLLIALRCQEN